MKYGTQLYRIPVLFLIILSLLTGCAEKGKEEYFSYDSLLEEGAGKFLNADFEGARKIFSQIYNTDKKNTRAYMRMLSTDLCMNPDGKIFFDSLRHLAERDSRIGDMLKANISGTISSQNMGKIGEAVGELQEKVLKISDELKAFDNLIENRPGVPEYYFGRGCWRLALKKRNEAIQDFSKSVELKPGFVPGYTMLGAAWMTNDDYLQHLSIKDQYYRALFYYKKAYLMDSNNVQTLSGLAHLLGYFDEKDESVAYYEKLQRLEPGNPNHLIFSSIQKEMKGDFSGAIEDYKKLVRLFPEKAEYLYKLGVKKLGSGDKKGGLEDVHKALAMTGDSRLKETITGYLKSINEK